MTNIPLANDKQSRAIKSGLGGRRPGAGRKPGVRNKVTREIKDIAQSYGPKAITLLWGLAEGAESDAAKVAAIKEILDRGYGKASQLIAGDPAAPIIHRIERCVVSHSQD